MKPLASRTDFLKQSDIRAVTQRVKAVNGINLGQGICDLPTPQPIKDAAVQAIVNNKSIYTPYAGIDDLRDIVFEKAVSFNRIRCKDAGSVVISTGSTGAFVTAAMTLLNPGDEILLFEPFYGYHRNLLDMIGVVPQVVTLRGENWDFDLDEVRGRLSSNVKAILINTPTNPCGKVWTEAELTAILRLAEEYDQYIITDEIYEYMVYDNHTHVSMASLPGAFERTITISGFSKTFNMTGWRLGYAVGPPEIVEKMGLLNDLIYVCAPAPLQYGVAGSVHIGPEYFSEMQTSYTLKRRLMCETLEACGFELAWPQGAYYAFASFENLGRKAAGFTDDTAACQSVIDLAGVGTVAGRSFFEDPSHGQHFLRFCYAKEIPDLERACSRMRDAFGRL